MYSLLLLFVLQSAFGQTASWWHPAPDTNRLMTTYRTPFLLSTALISGGLVTYHQDTKERFQHFIRSRIDHQNTIEDYLQHGSYGLLIAGQLFGQKPLHTPKGQLIYALTSNIGAVGITSIIKELVNERRPNGGHLSFPSGHTTHAFAAATVLYWEYRESNPWIAYSGYSFACATGLLRIVHNRHWINDVLAGAGIGILVPTLVYYYAPFPGMKWAPASKAISFYPVYHSGGAGMGFSMKW